MTLAQFFNILLIAIALAMDSFSVAISGGASLKSVRFKDALFVAAYFGFFQCFMTLLGWQGGLLFNEVMRVYAPWVAMILLFLIGIRMIYEAFSKKEEEADFSLRHKMLLMLAIATSIDALGVGLGYSLLGEPVLTYSLIIGCVAFIFSGMGVYLGKVLKNILGNKAEILGGLILVGIALKMAFTQ